jgi:hypothetical protein
LEVEMRLKMKARQEVTAVTAGQYRGASKKEARAAGSVSEDHGMGFYLRQ